MTERVPDAEYLAHGAVHMPSYEMGYEEGESSANADWVMALDELPFEVERPSDVIIGVDELMRRLKKLESVLSEKQDEIPPPRPEPSKPFRMG